MPQFHELAVKEVKKETSDTVSIAFELSDDLQEVFDFQPGQYLTLRTVLDDEDIRRSYSICTSPSEKDLRVAVKQVEEGKFSTFANQVLKAGDTLQVMKPMGRFTATLNPENEKNYVFFAAGSGITPVMSLVKSILETEPKSEVTLFYGNKTFDSIIFREQLEGVKNLYIDRFRLVHILSRESLGNAINNGRIDRKKCDLLQSTILNIDNTDHFFICGPALMIQEVRDWLAEKHVDVEKVHFELFGTPTEQKNLNKKVDPEPQDGSKIKVVIDGDAVNFIFGKEDDNILDAANRVGADLPFACKGGVCCTCRAKVLQGEVEMKVNYALEKDEIDAGFVLTCQSVPKTDEVVIDFDEV